MIFSFSVFLIPRTCYRRRINNLDVIYGKDNRLLEVRHVVSMLCECTALHGKLKIIIVQACRGNEWDAAVGSPLPLGLVSAPGVSLSCDPLPRVPSSAISTEHSDVLVVQSSAPDTVSWTTGQGTYFIQAIAACLRRYGASKDFHGVLMAAFGAMMEKMAPTGVIATPTIDLRGLRGHIRLHQVCHDLRAFLLFVILLLYFAPST